MRLLMAREKLSPWDIAVRLAKSDRISPSSRSNMPAASHRTIASFVQGRKSQANTIRLLRDFLVEETDLHAETLDVSSAIVKAAKSNMFGPVTSRLKQDTLQEYCGIYALRASDDAHYAMSIIVDIEKNHKVLLARAVVRSVKSQICTFLAGYLVPKEHQFSITLVNGDYDSHYNVHVSHMERHITWAAKATKPWRHVGALPATVFVPAMEAGTVQPYAHETSSIWSPDRPVSSYRLIRLPSEREQYMDLFRDAFDISTGREMYGAFPEVGYRDPGHTVPGYDY